MTEPRFFRSDGCFGLTLALRALREARQGPATDADAPPISVLPHTRASREALRLRFEEESRIAAQRYRVVNRDGVIVRERPTDSATADGEAPAAGLPDSSAAGSTSNVVPITAARRK